MDNIRVNLPGALDGAIKLELFNVLDSFLNETSLWTEDNNITLSSGQTTYGVSGTGVSRVIRLMFVSDPTLTRSYQATMKLPGEIVFSSDPTDGEEVVARVALSVVDPVDSEGYPYVPEWITEKYYECIKHGVLGAMMSQLAKPYTNERMAVYHSRKHRNLMAVARDEGRKMNLFAAQTWFYPQNFR